MLTIKRVPTVVSNYQEEDNNEEKQETQLGCGRNCLGNCCLPVSNFPLYAFKKERKEACENGVVPTSAKTDVSHISFLSLLLGHWEDRINRGLFRYDVTTCETRIIPGQYGFIAQLNEGRHLKKRPTEFRIDQVLQPFDENKFNFRKIGQEEVLFRFEQSNDHSSHYCPSAPVYSGSSPPNVIAINVSPIEYGHVLLIPRLSDCLPQQIDNKSFLLALHMAKEAADPFFRLGYNSLGAFATINHLHFQAYYLGSLLPVEKVPTRRIITMERVHKRGVVVSELLKYPVQALVFQGGNTMQDLADVVAKSCITLQNSNTPYNILISDCGKKIFLFPQYYAKKQALGEVSQEFLDTRVNPAAWEISGHMVLKTRKDYDGATEEYALRFLAEASLSEDRFQEVKAYVLEAAGLQEVAMDNVNKEDERALCEAEPSTPTAPCFPKDFMFPQEEFQLLF
ncbi:hypothetical protein RJ641_023151 [Dillenia turbinata]|uniref:GDP-D-glucose phosphorylase 1 n=1 Tax=Dillenia turbinata TaxID=194707 RepID=A0AAN8UDR6_9MAGN